MSEPSHGHRGHGTGRRRAGAHGSRPAAAPGGSSGGAPGTPGGAPADERPPGGRAAARKAARGGRKRGRRALKITGLVVGFLVLATGGAAGYAYWKLNSNIQSDDLSANGKDGAGHEKADAFGRTPINILVIGSDGRTNAKDCKLGGACKTAGGERADVEMVVHISADRTNATVMSVPRDLRADWSGCHDDGHQSMGPQHNTMINAALAGGPGCSVVAVHELTGIPIDHFMKVDFSGVVDMSNAVGGVQVCVDADVYDPYSHLKLKAGKHTLQGDAALEFLRTRHGFGDSSDSRGRTEGQHVFLTALLNKLKDDGTLSSPSKMWKLANAATKALTVDNSLDSITKLIGLGEDLNKVPTNRVTFATLQTADTKVNGVYETHLVQPGASALFKTIADDQSLTTASGAKTTAGATATASAAPTVAPGTVAVQVRNGAAKDGALVPGRASDVVTELKARGFKLATAVTGAATPTTSLTYPAGGQPQAQAVAKALGIPAADVKQTADATGVVLTVGSDWTTGTTFPGAKVDASDSQRKTALDGSNYQNGSDKGSCAKVSKYDDVIGVDANGHVTTKDNPPHSTSPTHAYAISPNVKDSAP
ncbi:LCP family protein [Actinacidiphila epipremni]|uniref:LCP family protein n=1 Tax=Actinacidiphila epipremni TaxID=2053013 RepID=UPI0019CFABEF|nr:LCP family protein [Actinacidiphila epipremni]